MTYETRKTGFKGFPVQYDPQLVRRLNEAIEKRSLDNSWLLRAGQAVSDDVEHLQYPRTEDDDWFGGLKFRLFKGERVRQAVSIVILVPWDQMKTSIRVYSDRELPREIVADLLGKIADQFEIL